MPAMSENARRRRDYERGCTLTVEVVNRFKPRGPAFAFPPRDIAFIASLADVGEKLARNDVARELVVALLAACVRLDDAPTVMMLRVALEVAGIPISYVSFEELGITGQLVPLGRGPFNG